MRAGTVGDSVGAVGRDRQPPKASGPGAKRRQAPSEGKEPAGRTTWWGWAGGENSTLITKLQHPTAQPRLHPEVQLVGVWEFALIEFDTVDRQLLDPLH